MECRPWHEMTREVLVDIFRRVDFEQRYSVLPFVCKAWWRAGRDSICWSVADMDECFLRRQEVSGWWSVEFEQKMDAMVINVVNWSCGGLSELHTRHCTNAAVLYLTERCPQLSSLSIKESPGFTDASAVTVARVCLNLRHLDITDCKNVSIVSLMEFGRNSKFLVTLRRNMLTLENNWQRRELIPWVYLSAQPASSADEEAQVISTMPELECLEFRFSGLTDLGLDAIAQGCRKLQHLSLFGCKRLTIAGLDSAAEKLPDLKSFERPTPVAANFVDSLRYGHWQLYSERFQPSFQF